MSLEDVTSDFENIHVNTDITCLIIEDLYSSIEWPFFNDDDITANTAREVIPDSRAKESIEQTLVSLIFKYPNITELHLLLCTSWWESDYPLSSFPARSSEKVDTEPPVHTSEIFLYTYPSGLERSGKKLFTERMDVWGYLLQRTRVY